MNKAREHDSFRVLVILPCFNEQGRVGQVLRSVRKHMPLADVVVIDDASQDGSPMEAAQTGAVVLRMACNHGYGAALEVGYLYATRHDYDFVLQMDSDGQHLASELLKLIAPLREGVADLTIGSRYVPKPSAGFPPLLRRIGHKVFSAILLLLTGMRFTDPTSGFRGLNRRAVSLFSSGIFPCDYPDSDVILMAFLAGLRIAEVRTEMKPRVGGKSMHSGLEPLYYGLKMLFSMFIVLLNYRSWRCWRAKLQTDSIQAQAPFHKFGKGGPS